MKRRKNLKLVSMTVTIAMMMSLGGYVFADETEISDVEESTTVEEEDLSEESTIESDDEETEATIVAIENYNMEYQTDKDALEECLMVAGVKLPLKRIIGKVERTYFDWEGKKE